MSSSSLVLREERSVSDVLNVSFRFVRLHWRILLKSLCYLLLPPVIVGQLLLMAGGMEGAITYFLNPMAVFQGRVDQASMIVLGVAASAVMSIIGTALGMTAVLSVVRLHEDEGPDAVTFERVLGHTKARVLRVIGTQLTVGVGLGMAAVIVLIPCLGALVYLAGLFFVVVRYVFLTIPIQVMGDESFTGSFRRTDALAKGQFWQTAGVFVLTMIIAFICSGIFTLPIQVIQFTSEFHSAGGYPTWLKVLFVGLITLSNAGSVVSVTLQSVAGGVQFLNLDAQRSYTGGMEQEVEELEQRVEEEDPTGEDGDAAASEGESSGSSPER